MHIVKFALVAAVAINVAVSEAKAATLGDYEQSLSDPNLKALSIMYLGGVEEGLGYGNAFNAYHGLPLMYCQPDKLSLTNDEDGRILDTYINDHKPALSTDLAAAMLMAFREAFPCNN